MGTMSIPNIYLSLPGSNGGIYKTEIPTVKTASEQELSCEHLFNVCEGPVQLSQASVILHQCNLLYILHCGFTESEQLNDIYSMFLFSLVFTCACLPC